MFVCFWAPEVTAAFPICHTRNVVDFEGTQKRNDRAVHTDKNARHTSVHATVSHVTDVTLGLR